MSAMEAQITGLHKRKSLEELGSTEPEGIENKRTVNISQEGKFESDECVGETALKIDDMGEAQDVSASGLTGKLSSAVVIEGSQADLVSQHAKVAEEAIAGWEKAEIEAMVMKQRLESLAKQNSKLEDRANHLECALKEVVSKLRQANEEQELRIREAVLKETHNWESRKTEFANEILQLQARIDSYKAEASGMNLKLRFLEEENSAFRAELRTQSEELEIRTIERDLSAEAAEKASKQNLESIKRVARLEAECRRVRSVTQTSVSGSDRKSGVASSFYADSLTDSHSDNGERLQAGDTEFPCNELLNAMQAGSGVEMDLMDNFLEIERLAALPEINSKDQNEPAMIHNKLSSTDDISIEEARRHADKLEEKLNMTEAEKHDLENELEKIKIQKTEIEEDLKHLLHAQTVLEENVKRIEMEKSELEAALCKSQRDTTLLDVQLRDAKAKVNELQREFTTAYEVQQNYKSQVMGYELEAKIMSSRVESLESKLKTEQALSAELTVKCQDFENEMFRAKLEIEHLQSTISSTQSKIKQDDLAAAAGKLAECQLTIASLGIQLKSLASIDEFLTDTSITQESGEVLSCSDDARGRNGDASKTNDDSPASSSSSSSASSVGQVTGEKGRNGFIKLFSRSHRGKVHA